MYSLTLARDECVPNPCQNEGECVDGIGVFSCNCRVTELVVYSGKNCTEGLCKSVYVQVISQIGLII